jgi:hypothetical protein
VFRVEFLMEGKKPAEAKMIHAAEDQLTFYLVEKGEEDPWYYAQYHCGTAANAYSVIHWSFVAKGSVARPE